MKKLICKIFAIIGIVLSVISFIYILRTITYPEADNNPMGMGLWLSSVLFSISAAIFYVIDSIICYKKYYPYKYFLIDLIFSSICLLMLITIGLYSDLLTSIICNVFHVLLFLFKIHSIYKVYKMPL